MVEIAGNFLAGEKKLGKAGMGRCGKNKIKTKTDKIREI